MSIPWGVSISAGITGPDLDNFEALVGKKIGILGIGTWWWTGGTYPTGHYQPFPKSKSDLINSRGGVLLWDWDPGLSNGNDPQFRNSAVLAGTFDAYIDAQADTIKALPYEIWVRPLHEMNGSWYKTWWEGSTSNAGLGSGQFIATYRYIVDRVRARGATNIKWVWNPNNQSTSPSGSTYQPFSQLYPGDAYVDMKGIDGYNFANGQAWLTMQRVMEGGIGLQDTLHNIVNVGNPSIPIIVPEFGCNAYDETRALNGAKKASWFTDCLVNYLPSQPLIAGIVYSHYNEGTGFWRIDWPLGGPQLAAFAAGIASNYYSGTVVTGGGGVTGTGPVGIVELPPTNLYRHETYGSMDSVGRLYVHGDVGDPAVENFFNPPGTQDLIYDLHSEPERYDPTTKTWTTLDNPPVKLYQISFILDAQDRYIGCGAEILCFSPLLTTDTADAGGAPPDTYLYDPSIGSWEGVANSINGPTGTPCTSTGSPGGGGGLFFKFNGQFYCQEASSPTVNRSGFLQRYTGGTSGSWVEEADLTGLISQQDMPINPYGPSHSQPVTSDGRAIYTAAINSSIPARSNRLMFYAPATHSITYSSLAPVPVQNGSWDGSRYLYYWAYFSGQGQIVQYDTVTDVWTILSGPLAPSTPASNNGDIVATPTTLYMLGYVSSVSVTMVGDIYAYDLATGVWTNLNPIAIPVDIGNWIQGGVGDIGRHPITIKDTIGNGFYMVDWGGELWDNHVFYFGPTVSGDPGTDLHEPVLVPTIGRASVQVIG